MVAGIGDSALVWQVGLLDPQAWCKTFLLLNVLAPVCEVALVNRRIMVVLQELAVVRDLM
jgi:hypothetical protein